MFFARAASETARAARAVPLVSEVETHAIELHRVRELVLFLCQVCGGVWIDFQLALSAAEYGRAG